MEIIVIEKTPLMESSVSCGFANLAEDYVKGHLSLDELLITKPASTFFVRAQGESMQGSIYHGDLLVVDRSLDAQVGHVIIAILNGEFLCKRLTSKGHKFTLSADNPIFPPVNITGNDDFSIWGVVTAVVRSLTGNTLK
jgi:DNA polymerase V